MKLPSELICEKLRLLLTPWAHHVTEKRMFGGTCFLYKGKMCVGETKSRLMVRVLDKDIARELEKPFVKPMDFTGKPMKEFIFVMPEMLISDTQWSHFVALGIAHAKTKV